MLRWFFTYLTVYQCLPVGLYRSMPDWLYMSIYLFDCTWAFTCCIVHELLPVVLYMSFYLLDCTGACLLNCTWAFTCIVDEHTCWIVHKRSYKAFYLLHHTKVFTCWISRCGPPRCPWCCAAELGHPGSQTCTWWPAVARCRGGRCWRSFQTGRPRTAGGCPVRQKPHMSYLRLYLTHCVPHRLCNSRTSSQDKLASNTYHGILILTYKYIVTSHSLSIQYT